MGTQHALGRRRRSPEELDAVLVGIVDRIARRLRAAHRVCRTVVLRLRFQDFTRATRSHTLPHATQQTEPILATARSLLATVMPTIERQGLTLLGIALTNLEDASAVQLVFSFERRHAIDEALDSVRDRFGTTAITRAVLLGRDQGQSVPLLPD
jgi:DNA polymerase-4